MKVAVFELAGTVTVEGTVAAEVFELERATRIPPDGAGPDNVTVPVKLLPPGAVAGTTVRLVRPAELPGVTVIWTHRLSPFKFPFIEALAFAAWL